MQSESQNTSYEDIQEDIESETITCPNCNETVPTSSFCQKCDFPLYELTEDSADKNIDDSKDNSEFFDIDSLKNIHDEMPKDSNETHSPTITLIEVQKEQEAMDLELDVEISHEEKHDMLEIKDSQIMTDSKTNAIEESGQETEKIIEYEEELLQDYITENTLEPSLIIKKEKISLEDDLEVSPKNMSYEPEVDFNFKITELVKELMNSISLQLWSITLLLDGGIEENYFKKIFNGYKGRFKQCMNIRSEMLDDVHDVKFSEKKLNEAKFHIGELEIRSELRDLHKGEYEAKTPALKWTIEYQENQIQKKNKKLLALTELYKLIPEGITADYKENFKMALDATEGLNSSRKIRYETITNIKSSIDDILAFLSATE